jgi:type I restriction enzyme, S subunit
MSKWREAALSDVAEISLSNVDKKIFPDEIDVLLCNYMDVYANRYINSKLNFSLGSVNKQELDKFRLNEKDVIITKDSETADDIAVPAVVTENIDSLVCGYHLAIISPHSDRLDGLFLMNLFQIPEVKNQFSNYANGITRYGLTKDAIYNIRLRFPTSLPEQRKIAKILSAVDAVIEKTGQTIEKYKAIKQGMMHDLFTRGLDKNGKLRPRYEDAPPLYKKTELGWVPKEWGVVKLGDVTDKIADRDHYTPKYCDYGIPMISPKDFDEEEKISFDKCVYVSLEEHQRNMKKTDLHEGDLVFTRIGALLGKVCIIGKCMPTFSILHSACMIRANTKLLLSEYLCFFMKSPFFQNQILSEIQSIGVPDLGLEKIKSFKIIRPKTIEEQEKIALNIKEIEHALVIEQRTLYKNKNLKLALMQDLLTGSKRVKVENELEKTIESKAFN